MLSIQSPPSLFLLLLYRIQSHQHSPIRIKTSTFDINFEFFFYQIKPYQWRELRAIRGLRFSRFSFVTDRDPDGGAEELGGGGRRRGEGRGEQQCGGLADEQEADRGEIGGEVPADAVGARRGAGRVLRLLDGALLRVLDNAGCRVRET